jgi:DNA replication protein DnaC
MNTQAQQLAYNLKLFGVHAAIEARAQEAIARQLHPSEFLALVLEDERLSRKDRLAKSLATRAKFRRDAVVEDWDSTFDRGLPKAAVKELAALGFFRNNQNLIILGRTGEGKTHLAISLGRRLCEDGQSVAFLSMGLLFEEVLAARAAGKVIGYLTKLNQTKTLIFDDFGLRCYTHEEAGVLVELLEARSRKGPVIVTSQVDPQGWPKLFEDPVIAEAVVDRLLNPSQRVQLKGGTYRDRFNALPVGKNLASKSVLI